MGLVGGKVQIMARYVPDNFSCSYNRFQFRGTERDLSQ